MSCPECGNPLTPHNIKTLFFSLIILAFVFGLALLEFSYELFFVVAVVELFALNYIEKQFKLFEGKEHHCDFCGYTKRAVYQHHHSTVAN